MGREGEDRRRTVGLVEMIEEAAAASLVVERPAERVLNVAFLEILFRHRPELFQANAVFLRVAVFREIKFLDQLLRQGLRRSRQARDISSATLGPCAVLGRWGCARRTPSNATKHNIAAAIVGPVGAMVSQPLEMMSLP